MQMIILHRLLFYFCSNGLSTVTTKAFNQILNDKDGFIRQMQENIAKAITTADTMSPDGIQTRLEITVYDDRFTVKFKSGLAIEIEA